MELSVNRNQKRGLLASTPASLRDRRSKGKREGILSARKARGAREEGGKGSPPSPLSSLLPRAPLAIPSRLKYPFPIISNTHHADYTNTYSTQRKNASSAYF